MNDYEIIQTFFQTLNESQAIISNVVILLSRFRTCLHSQHLSITKTLPLTLLGYNIIAFIHLLQISILSKHFSLFFFFFFKICYYFGEDTVWNLLIVCSH